MAFLVAWIQWDPQRFIYIIPWFNHPITWYGLLFATGFLVGLLIWKQIILQWLYTTYLYFTVSQVTDWQKSLSYFEEGGRWHSLLERGERKLLQHHKKGVEPTDSLKKALVAALNRGIEEESPLLQGEGTPLCSHLSKKALTRLGIEKVSSSVFLSVKQVVLLLSDRLLLYLVLGTLIGARLGHMLFYNWYLFLHNPWVIFKVWEGGLASHGGFVGVLIGIYFVSRYAKQYVPHLGAFRMMDTLMIPALFVSTCIRIGNFINQEIVGIPTTLPWAILFGHPYDGSPSVPRHPAQLYEACCYFLLFVIFYVMWKKKGIWQKPGMQAGVGIVYIYTSRFFIEFVKNPQSDLLTEHTPLLMGQYLSVPVIIFGLFLIFRRRTLKQTCK